VKSSPPSSMTTLLRSQSMLLVLLAFGLLARTTTTTQQLATAASHGRECAVAGRSSAPGLAFIRGDLALHRVERHWMRSAEGIILAAESLMAASAYVNFPWDGHGRGYALWLVRSRVHQRQRNGSAQKIGTKVATSTHCTSLIHRTCQCINIKCIGLLREFRITNDKETLKSLCMDTT